jgi:hypothetical protein
MTVFNKFKPPNWFWGDEKQYILNALETYKEARIEQIKKIESKGKVPFFTVNYIDQMTELLTGKIKNLSWEPSNEVEE